MVDETLADLRQVVETVNEIRGPEKEARTLANIVALCAERGQRAALEEGGRTDDRFVGGVVAAVVSAPSLLSY